MMIQTSIIQIDGSTGCHTVICNAHFGMTEARCPFINTYTILDQFMIKRSGDTVDHFFVRNSRSNDSDIHATFGSKCQRVRHFISNDQIWGHKPTILFRLIHHADVNFFSHLLIIQWTVCIWLNKSGLLCFIRIICQKP